MSHYISYYNDQVGSGGIEHVYVGSPYQRGHGIGSFLAGLFRSALPLFRSGARAVGREAFRAGINVIDDISSQNIPFKDAVRSRTREAGSHLKRKAEEKIESLMSGSGYKRLRQRGVRQSKSVRKTKRIPRSLKSKKKKRATKKRIKRNTKKRTVRDIFGPI